MDLKINEKIYELRRGKQMTQEQLANALGVTAPAVNKWEKGNSYPDITLLAPLARILDTTLDELLSFQRELTDREVLKLEADLGKRFEAEGYETALEACEKYLKEYPNFLCLKFRVANLISSMLLICNVQGDRTDYQARARELLEEVAAGTRVDLAEAAKVMLVGHYMGKKDFDKAEQILDGMPDLIYDKRDLYPSLYLQQNKLDKAQKMFETELFQKLNRIILALNSLKGIYIRRGDRERAKKYIDMGAELLTMFGLHHTTVCEQYLDFYMNSGDRSLALDWLERYLEEFDRISFDYSDSFFFSTLELKESKENMTQLRRLLVQSFETEEEWEELRGEERFQKALEKFRLQTP